jgi:putative GTP pyrophosphokinase
MTEDELLARWHSERPMHEAWGKYIVDQIADALKSKLGEWEVDLFLRIPVKPRAKADNSLVEKAFYRKSYLNPYDDITDKIGIRYVVLLHSDIKILSEIIESSASWTASKDRDYEAEQDKNPIQFDYAAVHYVVRAKADLTYEGVPIAIGTACEIQVKNILQHAYSELTHDTIYKSKIEATPPMRRNAAKSMALIEATSDYFQAVSAQVQGITNPNRDLSSKLKVLYEKKVGIQPQPTRLEGYLIDALVNGRNDDEIIQRSETMFSQRPFLAARIGERAASRLLFRQSSIILVYLSAIESPSATKAKWPLTPGELKPVYTDLGMSLESI